MTLATLHFQKFLEDHFQTVLGNMFVKLEGRILTVLEQLAFNVQKLTMSHCPRTY